MNFVNSRLWMVVEGSRRVDRVGGFRRGWVRRTLCHGEVATGEGFNIVKYRIDSLHFYLLIY